MWVNIKGRRRFRNELYTLHQQPFGQWLPLWEQGIRLSHEGAERSDRSGRNGENRNDSYRQRTKYDDRVDSYFSTYDLGILLQNRDSYLEGKLDSNGDVDCYSFSYAQKSFLR